VLFAPSARRRTHSAPVSFSAGFIKNACGVKIQLARCEPNLISCHHALVIFPGAFQESAPRAVIEKSAFLCARVYMSERHGDDDSIHVARPAEGGFHFFARIRTFGQKAPDETAKTLPSSSVTPEWRNNVLQRVIVKMIISQNSFCTPTSSVK
jgi:hypothetical protein